MNNILRLIVPVVLLILGGYFFYESYAAYGNWREWLTLDPSGAELYELNFQLYTPPAFLLFGAGCFLAGRWWFR